MESAFVNSSNFISLPEAARQATYPSGLTRTAPSGSKPYRSRNTPSLSSRPGRPILWKATGTPIEALRDQNASIGVPTSLLGRRGEHYALEVAGDSMIEAGIFDGDTIIIERADTAENGAVVVALIDEQEVTLKRLRRRGASIALEPANKAYETRIFGPDSVKVQGRLVALLRRY